MTHCLVAGEGTVDNVAPWTRIFGQGIIASTRTVLSQKSSEFKGLSREHPVYVHSAGIGLVQLYNFSTGHFQASLTKIPSNLWKKVKKSVVLLHEK